MEPELRKVGERENHGRNGTTVDTEPEIVHKRERDRRQWSILTRNQLSKSLEMQFAGVRFLQSRAEQGKSKE